MLYDLTIFQKAYDFLLWVKPTVQRFAKVHKYSLGVQLNLSKVRPYSDLAIGETLVETLLSRNYTLTR